MRSNNEFIFPLDQVLSKDSEIGIGQPVLVAYRNKWIEYLPWIYAMNCEVESKKQEEIVSFDMLIYPFDKYTWYFTIASSFAMLLSFATIQVLWCSFSGDEVKIGWMFQGIPMSVYIFAIKAVKMTQCFF